MKYLWTTMHVKNLEKSIEFYEQVLGLQLKGRFAAGPGSEIGFLTSQNTETKIELIQQQGFDRSAAPAGISLGFAAGNLDEKREQLRAAGYAPGTIISPNPATRFFFLEDPDGVQIQFVEG